MRGRAFDIGLKPIADRERALRRGLAEQCRGLLINGRIGFAKIDGAAAERLIEIGDLPGAWDEPPAALDEPIGIGADERLAGRGRWRQKRAIIFGGLALIIFKTAAEDKIGVLDLTRAQFGIVEQAEIARRA